MVLKCKLSDAPSNSQRKMESTDENEALLSGIRIIDLADEKAGFCSKLFADLGASVIKIERPGGNPSRQIGPLLEDTPSPGGSLSFWYSNTNKQGITLDIEKDEGRTLFLRFVEGTDVLVDTFTPGYLEKLGLGFNLLSETNPGLILASVTGFGQNGPRSQYKSCDLVTSAFGGQMYVSGSPSTPPLKPYGEQSSYAGSLFAAIGILLALRKRASSGKGEHIDISLQEAVASTLDHVMVPYFYEGIIPKRQGSLSWNNSSFILPCKEGHIHLNLSTQWETLIEWMASEGMADDLIDVKWKVEEYRQRNMTHVIDIMERWTRSHSAREIFDLGQGMRFPWAPVYSPEEALNSPQLRERKFFVDVNHPELGTALPYPGVPYRFNQSEPKQWKRAPLVGEDNAQVYGKELGLSEDELKRLSSLKVI
jgi:crotonobetainyl-CoA:carnitine CoA-transferase CaiB-like acyl-CoA transferase